MNGLIIYLFLILWKGNINKLNNINIIPYKNELKAFSIIISKLTLNLYCLLIAFAFIIIEIWAT